MFAFHNHLLINIDKALHILCVLALVGLMLMSQASILYSQLKHQPEFLIQDLNWAIRLDEWLLFLIPLLYLSGALLVIPKGYQFTTPWIDAAFIFLAIIFFLILLSRYLKCLALASRRSLLCLHLVYVAIWLICSFIIHDAVTKQTWLVLYS